jgi:uncharacterized protein YkwD
MERYGNIVGKAGENIAFGMDDGLEVLLQLIIDDGVKSRGHRLAIYEPAYKLAGVACGPHTTWKTMCVMDLADEFIELPADARP